MEALGWGSVDGAAGETTTWNACSLDQSRIRVPATLLLKDLASSLCACEAAANGSSTWVLSPTRETKMEFPVTEFDLN